ncbi:hypothetical protein TYRP_016215 [Tyrophagus putrescentiae]|nr:hypothetical protein TYRP_016215 [Tyrophagus putrescentiae]
MWGLLAVRSLLPTAEAFAEAYSDDSSLLDDDDDDDGDDDDQSRDGNNDDGVDNMLTSQIDNTEPDHDQGKIKCEKIGFGELAQLGPQLPSSQRRPSQCSTREYNLGAKRAHGQGPKKHGRH